MPIVHFKNSDAYDKAVAVLLRRGGAFSGREPLTLVVHPVQFQALVEAGLAKSPPSLKERHHGQKKAKT